MNNILFKKGSVLVLAIIFVSISAFPSAAINKLEKTAFSSIVGKTLYVGGTGPGNYSKIQDAIENASDGNLFVQDTVLVFSDSSPYHENIVVDKTIKLYGEDDGFPVIDGSGNDDAIVRINGGYCAIRGFKIIGDKTKNNMIGIKIDSSNCFVGKNKIMDVDQGIYISNGLIDNYLSANIISNVSIGIVAYNSDQNGIIGNYISSCGLYGIYICGSNDEYTFYNNHIMYNEIFNNNIGICIENSNDNKVWANLIFDNSGGLEFCCESYNNTIFCNNFEKNQNWSAHDEGISQWDNGKKGNYWDDYDGIDTNGDGIGDTPYLINGGDNKDLYPLMKPWDNHAPSPPIINGPLDSRVRVKCQYTFISTDPDGDDVCYIINWGDGEIDVTTFLPSNTEVTVNHTYCSKGIKTITAYASDEYYWCGGLGEFKVTIARNRVSLNSLFLKLVERFSILQQLINRIITN